MFSGSDLQSFDSLSPDSPQNKGLEASSVDLLLSKQSARNMTPIFSQKAVERCHVILPDTPQPTGAIRYEGQYYAFVKFFPTVEVARQKAALMTQRGNRVLLTRVPKGLVLWVLEADARRVEKP
ncbi:MAG TPA: hypothetical protein V6C84_02635 [Coleofasciculaceae cyanobacterium]|jgi:hypothetical protein